MAWGSKQWPYLLQDGLTLKPREVQQVYTRGEGEGGKLRIAPKTAQPRLLDTSHSKWQGCYEAYYVVAVTSFFGSGTKSPNLNTAFSLKSPNLNTAFSQESPNLMPTKFSCYTVLVLSPILRRTRCFHNQQLIP